MEGELRGDEIRVGKNARQRFYDSRGYGRPDGDEIVLTRVEAAHLLYRGDLDTIDGMRFREFFTSSIGDGFGVRFFVYKDLRERGFYLAPAHSDSRTDSFATADFIVFPRGSRPNDTEIEYAIRVVGERAFISWTDLVPGVLAVVDEESEISYFQVEPFDPTGDSEHHLPTGIAGSLLADRVILWDPPIELYRDGFFGQPLGGRSAVDDAIQLSLVEAGYLSSQDAICVDGGTEAILTKGRAVEGDRFDRRLRIYDSLRSRGLVPKTGYKFGADFRTYASIDTIDNLGHSETLVRVVPPDRSFAPRDLALDVRLAHGVNKRMVFALSPTNESTEPNWLSIRRLTP